MRQAFVYITRTPNSRFTVELTVSVRPAKYGDSISPFHPDDPITPKIKAFVAEWWRQAGSTFGGNEQLLVETGPAACAAAAALGVNAVFMPGSATNPPHAWLTIPDE